MSNTKFTLESFIADESGQDLIEYALVASFISLIAITAVKGIGTQINTMFSAIQTTLTPTP